MTDRLIESVLRGVLGGRRKRSRNALRFLTGGRGRNPLMNPSTLLTAAGVAWGIYETLQQRGVQPAAAVPPLPGSHAPAQPVVASMPGAPAGAPPVPGSATDVPPPHVLRLLRLAVSAAYADGDLDAKEHAAILQQARSSDASGALERELTARRPLAEIVAGVSDPAEGATMYVLAYTILRADEQLSNSERIYLAQLANLLGLDPATAQSLEKDTGERIDALGDQGQPGG